jgi:D-beta-D-heptose 7-phosphate kinase/D-beta-D-heptose 1-phosphate adenosyltransferase
VTSEEAHVVRISADRLLEVLEGLAAVRVSIFGDLMLDRYVWGDVSRISPEAPVPVVEVTRDSVRFGGAANVAENVASLGASAAVVGVVGDDAAGRELLDLLRGRGVDVERVLVDPNRPTTTKTRIIAHSQQVVRADREDASDVSGPASADMESRLNAAVAESDVLVVSDYGKGVVTGAVLPGAVARARSAGKIICVDPKESHFESYVGVTALTPNQKEAGSALGRKITDDESLAEVGWELSRRLEAECVVITRGERGMSLFLRGGEQVHLPTVAREVYDVTGAGDTVVSVLATALAAGATMVEAALIANHAAGIVIREIGTASVTREEIERSFADAEEEWERG